MRWVLLRMVFANSDLLSAGMSGSWRVSANPPTIVSGVRSSCETFATKSRRTASSFRMGVRSNKATTAPPFTSGRAVSERVLSPIDTSSGSVSVPLKALEIALRSVASRGRKSMANGTGRLTESRCLPVSLIRTTSCSGEIAITPSLSVSTSADSIDRSAVSADNRASSCSASLWIASARSPTSPGAASAGCRRRSPAAIDRATSLSSVIGLETEREKSSASTAASRNEMRPAAMTPFRARAKISSIAFVVTLTRATPLGDLTAT